MRVATSARQPLDPARISLTGWALTFTPVKSRRWAADARANGLGSQVGADGPASTVDVGDPALRALIAEIVDERLERRRS